MDPFLQTPGQQNPNPYEFILNPQKPSKQSPVKKFGGNRFILTIAILVGGALLLMIVATIILNAFAPKKVSPQQLISLAQTQNEIIRVSSSIEPTVRQQVTKNLAYTIELSVQSQQKQTLNLLGKNGVKVSAKQLALKQDATTDRKFTSAKATSTLDITYSQVIQQQLDDYANALKQIYSGGATSSEKDLTSTLYQQVQLLISQIPYAQNTINSAGQ